LAVALQRLVERSRVAGWLRCNFRSDNISENSLPPRAQRELLRIAQEAIHNRRPPRRRPSQWVFTAIAANLELQIRDNGHGIPAAELLSQEGFGLGNMQSRAKKIGASLNIQWPSTTTTRSNEGRPTQIHWQRGGVFAGVPVADNCFSTKLLSYRGLGYVTCRQFRRLLVMHAEQFHKPSLFW
jgi:glucose-6-phosphate-specific signal transduction histidine kinase